MKYTRVSKIRVITTNLYITLSGTVSDIAWFTAAALATVIAGISLTIPGIGGVAILKIIIVAGTLIAFPEARITTNDKATNTRFIKTVCIGI